MAVQDAASDNDYQVIRSWSTEHLTGWRASLAVQSWIIFVVLTANIIMILLVNFSNFEQINGISTLSIQDRVIPRTTLISGRILYSISLVR